MNNPDKDYEFGQMDIAKCKQHPKMVISFLYYKQNCPYTSRLVCVKCLKEQKIQNGFEDLLDVLQDSRVLLDKSDRPQGIYDLLNEYFKTLEQDPEEFINSLKEDILKQIQKLHQDLKQGIEKYNKLRQEIVKVKQQFGEALGHAQLRQAFKDILKVENYHQSEEWAKLEDKMSTFTLQFEDQKNQELKESYYRLKEMAQQFMQPQLLNEFKSSISKSTELQCKKLENLGRFQNFTQFNDQSQVFELMDKIQNNMELPPNIKLIFKASQNGMNAQAFWNQCQNQGPTLTIHQKGNLSNNFWGESNLLRLKQWANIRRTTQSLYWHNLTGMYYSTEKYKVKDFQTHLMEYYTPELVEMKVFLIE